MSRNMFKEHVEKEIAGKWKLNKQEKDMFELKFEKSNATERYTYFSKISSDLRKKLREDVIFFRLDLEEIPKDPDRNEYRVYGKDFAFYIRYSSKKWICKLFIEKEDKTKTEKRIKRMHNCLMEQLLEINELRLPVLTGMLEMEMVIN